MPGTLHLPLYGAVKMTCLAARHLLNGTVAAASASIWPSARCESVDRIVWNCRSLPKRDLRRARGAHLAKHFVTNNQAYNVQLSSGMREPWLWRTWKVEMYRLRCRILLQSQLSEETLADSQSDLQDQQSGTNRRRHGSKTTGPSTGHGTDYSCDCSYIGSRGPLQCYSDRDPAPVPNWRFCSFY